MGQMLRKLPEKEKWFAHILNDTIINQNRSEKHEHGQACLSMSKVKHGCLSTRKLDLGSFFPPYFDYKHHESR